MYSKIIEELSQIHQNITQKWEQYHLPTLEEEQNCPYEDCNYADLECYDTFTFNVLEDWIEDDTKRQQLNKEFVEFAQAGDGSQIAIWLQDANLLMKNPVVVLLSDGGAMGVIAPNYLSFMQLTAQGYSVSELAYLDDDKWCIANHRFEQFLQKEYGTITIQNAIALIEDSRILYPDLEQYLAIE